MLSIFNIPYQSYGYCSDRTSSVPTATRLPHSNAPGVAPHEFPPHFRDALLFAADLHPVVPERPVLARACLDCRERRVERRAAWSREMHALDVVVPVASDRHCQTRREPVLFKGRTRVEID